jgi:PAS domain-containing protein
VVFVYFQQEDAVMAQKPTYEELDQRVKALEKGMVKHEKAEEKLLSLEGKYRLLVENANAAMFIAQGGVVKFANHKTEDMMGYSSEQSLLMILFILTIGTWFLIGTGEGSTEKKSLLPIRLE